MKLKLNWCIYYILNAKIIIRSRHSSLELAMKRRNHNRFLDKKAWIFDKPELHLIGKTKEIEELQK